MHSSDSHLWWWLNQWFTCWQTSIVYLPSCSSRASETNFYVWQEFFDWPLCVLDAEQFPKMLLTIQIVEFLDHQHLWSESIDILVSLHGDNYQWKVVSGTNIFGWVWAGMPLIQWDCKILRRSVSPEEVKWYLRFFCTEIIINGRQPQRLLLLFECGYVCPSSKQIVRLFD